MPNSQLDLFSESLPGSGGVSPVEGAAPLPVGARSRVINVCGRQAVDFVELRSDYLDDLDPFTTLDAPDWLPVGGSIAQPHHDFVYDVGHVERVPAFLYM